MSQAKVEKRVKTMKCFVKYVNVNHLMPTRYMTSKVLELKSVFRDPLKEADK